MPSCNISRIYFFYLSVPIFNHLYIQPYIQPIYFCKVSFVSTIWGLQVHVKKHTLAPPHMGYFVQFHTCRDTSMEIADIFLNWGFMYNFKSIITISWCLNKRGTVDIKLPINLWHESAIAFIFVKYLENHILIQ